MCATGLDDLAGVPQEVIIGGDPYQVHPLKARDLAEFQGWYKNKRKRENRDLANDLYELCQKKGFKSAEIATEMRLVIAQRVTDEELTDAMGEPESIEYLLWVSLRKGKPGMTREEAGALVSWNQDGIRRLMSILLQRDQLPNKFNGAEEVAGELVRNASPGGAKPFADTEEPIKFGQGADPQPAGGAAKNG